MVNRKVNPLLREWLGLAEDDVYFGMEDGDIVRHALVAVDASIVSLKGNYETKEKGIKE